MRIEIRQEWMTDAAETLRPDLQRGHWVARKTKQLGAFFIILLQRTVEGRSLVGSSARESERVCRDDHPFRTMILAKRDFAAVVGLELEFRGCFAEFRHDLLLETRD